MSLRELSWWLMFCAFAICTIGDDILAQLEIITAQELVGLFFIHLTTYLILAAIIANIFYNEEVQ